MIGPELVEGLIWDLVGLYRWPPSTVLELTLCEAFDARMAALRARLTEAGVIAAGVFEPELLGDILGESEEKRPLTIEEEFGEKVAAEVEELREKNRRWVEERRRGNNRHK